MILLRLVGLLWLRIDHSFFAGVLVAMTALIIAKGRVAWVSLEVTDRGSELIGELLASLGTVVGATLRGHASCWHVIDVRWLIARRSGASHGPKTCQRIQAGLIEPLVRV